MKKILLLLVTLTGFLSAFGHNLNYEKVLPRQWTLHGEKQPVWGTFHHCHDGQVFIETVDGITRAFPMQQLAEEDRRFVERRQARIDALNQRLVISRSVSSKARSWTWVLPLALLLLLAGLFFVPPLRPKRKYLIPVLLTGCFALASGFRKGEFRLMSSSTDPLSIDSAFTPFRPNVNTFWDPTYFHVESQGIPTTHEMMVGISDHGWQQQVPIPQCYLGNNSWSIPLNPTVAATPVPVSPAHFTRGAIAVAVNGVAIFSPYTNTGVDAYLDGQLDDFGGHCGRADDYHYHIAPLHLYAYTSPTLPVAYALDGYAVYGALEPDGTPMAALDVNHGHFGSNGVYHYHGSAAAPYMIGNMVGVVTEDSTHQIVPQAAARAVRPWLTPLSGALITDCTPNGTGNGYTLTYTLAGSTDSIVYSWTPTGVYTFNFYTASGLNTQVYNGFVPCSLSTGLSDAFALTSSLNLFPNPVTDHLRIALAPGIPISSVEETSVMSLDGRMHFRSARFESDISTVGLAPGIYLLRVRIGNEPVVRKFIVQ